MFKKLLQGFVAIAALGAAGFAAPGVMNYSGRLVNASGGPVSAPTALSFSFYNALTTGTAILGYTYDTTVTPNADGLYSVSIGDTGAGTGGPVPAEIFDAPAVWLNVNIGGEDLAPRVRIATTAYAFRADQSTTAATALQANSAFQALNATHADSADNATNATHADSADQANEANNADNATTASFAFQSNSSLHADESTTAIQALGLEGNAFMTAPSTGTAIENGMALLGAYQQAKALRPNNQDLAATNRAVLLVPPGRYDLTTQSLTLDTEFVDLVGLSSNRESQWITGLANGTGTGVLIQTANNVHIENLTVECTQSTGNLTGSPSDPATYFPEAPGTTNTLVNNCTFLSDNQHAYSMRVGIEYAGTYSNCTGGIEAFGGYNIGIASGTFNNCTGGDFAFGGYYGTASGTFKNCTGGDFAFGGINGTVSGTFTNCTGGIEAFGGYTGIASGTFNDCTGGDFAFGGFLGTASGTFNNCTGGEHAFGGDGTTTGGEFQYCTGGGASFGPGSNNKFLYCIQDGAAYP